MTINKTGEVAYSNYWTNKKESKLQDFIEVSDNPFDKGKSPKNRVNRFDGDKLWFEVTKDEAKTYKHD